MFTPALVSRGLFRCSDELAVSNQHPIEESTDTHSDCSLLHSTFPWTLDPELREDPEHLFKIDHTKTWMTTREHVYYFGLMFVLLEEARFKIERSSVFGCSKRHEIAGCMPELGKYS